MLIFGLGFILKIFYCVNNDFIMSFTKYVNFFFFVIL